MKKFQRAIQDICKLLDSLLAQSSWPLDLTGIITDYATNEVIMIITETYTLCVDLNKVTELDVLSTDNRSSKERQQRQR